MKKLISVLLLLVFLLAGCGGETAPQNTLIYGSGDYTRINPAMDEHGEINLLLFNGLTAHDGANAVVPALAESWVYDEQSCSYTFYLRDDVTWHDGAPFTAADVKFTIEAIMNPDNGSENAANFEGVTAIDIIDEHTVCFHLEAPNVAFLDYMTIAILPQHLLSGKDMQSDAFFQAPIGTGPYKLAEWQPGQYIRLIRNDDYFLGAANIEQVVFKIVTDDNAKALQLRSKELHLAQLPAKIAVSFADSSDFSLYRMQTADYRGILFNFWNEYWQLNRDLIPAVCYALDRQAIVDAVLLGQGMVAYSPLQRNIYNNPDVEHYDYDPATARAVLEDAGCELGADGYYYRDGAKIGFIINAPAGDQTRIDMAQIAAQQLQQVGIDVTVEIPSSVDWGSQMAYLIGWGSPFDADDHTYKVFGTDKGANYSGYSNAAVDQYLQQARSTADTEARAAAYAAFQQELAADPAYAFICYIDANYVAAENISGITADTVLGHHGVGIFWNICDWTIE
ncbi:MAG: ABC transporter substrate-binding protein [Firmicutes bacterium]|nr:ABC transporter substrate-binding protein [Bacillota bacterium]